MAVQESLFRQEVFEARRVRLEGEVLLTQPIRAHVLTLILIALVGAIALWVALGTYTRSEAARGLLVTASPTTKVVATRPGRISALFVKDGDIVRAGQKIATILIEQPIESGASTSTESLQALDLQNRLARQQADLAKDRASADRAQLAATMAGLGRQRSDLAAQTDLQEQLVTSAQDDLDRIAPVMKQGFISKLEYEQRKQAWLNARKQLVQLRQQINALDAEEGKTRAQLARVGADAASEVATAETSAAGFIGQRAQALAQRAYVIVAPASGRVTAMQGAVGRTVDASPLMEIVPEGSPLHAEIYAPSSAVGFVRPGQEVRLLYDAFPYERFGSFAGRVTRVSRTALDPRDVTAPIKIEEPVYRIDVALERQSVDAYGSHLALQSGMTLAATLILDQRSFADWLLQPLHAVLRRSG